MFSNTANPTHNCICDLFGVAVHSENHLPFLGLSTSFQATAITLLAKSRPRSNNNPSDTIHMKHNTIDLVGTKSRLEKVNPSKVKEQ